MVTVSSLPSDININLKQYSRRDLVFAVSDAGSAIDWSTDTWAMRVVNESGIEVYDFTTTSGSITTDYTGSSMLITITANAPMVSVALTGAPYELRNHTRDVIHADGTLNVESSVSDNL